MTTPTPNHTISLHDLPLGARLILTVFLCAAGISYLAGLNQLHFQHAPAGEPLPSLNDTKDVYHGKEGVSMLERLITADESKPWNGTGSMKPAFTKKSGGWVRKLKERTKAHNGDEAAALKELRADREMEAQAIVAWIHSGAKKDEYAKFPLPANMQDDKVMERQEPDFFVKEDKGGWHANVSEIIQMRCARCHAPEASGPASEIHLDTYETVHDYLEPEKTGGGMSLRQLAQSTHVHLPGFSLLLGMTGLIFAFTRYPGFVRVILCPLPLTAQLIDVASWWLMRAEPEFAWVTVVMGGVAATGLALQVVLGVFDMYGWGGKVLWIVAILLALAGAGYVSVAYIEPYLKYEKEQPTARD